MKTLFVLCFTMLAGTPNPAVSQEPCAIENNTFTNGEQLTYEIGYKFGLFKAKAGSVVFNVDSATYQGKQAYHVKSVGKTYKSYDWFFKVHDVYESYIDAETMLPLKFKRDVDEGGFTINNEYTFKHQEKKVKIDKKMVKGKDKKKFEEAEIDACTQDILSAIYLTRCMDFTNAKKGEVRKIKVYLDAQEYEIGLKFLGREEIKTKYGKFKAIKFSPQLVSGTIFDEKDEMIVWATDDENKVPLLVEASITVGKIRAYLIHQKGLKHLLSSKVK